MSEQVRATAWIIEEYAEGEPMEQVSCRPVDNPDDPEEPRWQRNDLTGIDD